MPQCFIGHTPGGGTQNGEHGERQLKGVMLPNKDTSSSEHSEGDDSNDSDSDSEAEDLAFPASYTAALRQLLQSSQDQPVAVKALQLASKEEKLGLTKTLWSEGYLCTSKRAHAQPVGGASKACKVKRQKS